jgi:hypothetical protein
VAIYTLASDQTTWLRLDYAPDGSSYTATVLPGNPFQPPPISAGTSYDSVEYVLQLARARANDANISLLGNLLADTVLATFVRFNSAWRYLQRKLANSGYEAYVKEWAIASVPPAFAVDPVVQVMVGFSSSFDGSTYSGSPTLPPDLIIPQQVWERGSGTTDPFSPVHPANDGLPSIAQSSTLRYWEWRGEGIWFGGARAARDIKIRGLASMPDLIDPNAGTIDTGVLVPIRNSADALANYLVAEFALALGSPAAGTFQQQGDKSVEEMCRQTARKKQRGSHRRRPYGTIRSDRR